MFKLPSLLQPVKCSCTLLQWLSDYLPSTHTWNCCHLCFFDNVPILSIFNHSSEISPFALLISSFPSLSSLQRAGVLYLSQGARCIHTAHVKPVILPFVTGVSRTTELPCITASLQPPCLTTGPWFASAPWLCVCSFTPKTQANLAFIFFSCFHPLVCSDCSAPLVCLQKDSSLPVTADTQVLHVKR